MQQSNEMKASFFMSKSVQLVIFLVLLLLKTVFSSNQPNYVYTSYDPESNYTQNSLYQKNLYQLLENLGRKASENEFYNATNGESNDKIYGSFYCRGDVSVELCHECVKAAAQSLVKRGSSMIEAVSYYEECTLRYGNTLDDGNNVLWVWWFSEGNVSNPEDLQQLLSTKLNSLIDKAAYNDNYRGYATADAPFPPYPTAYFLVQCSPDFLGRPCENCLRRIYRDMQTCCDRGRHWIMIFRSKCQIRYDMAPFFTPLASPPGLAGSQPSPSPGADKDVIFYITRVAVPAAGFALLLLCIIILLVYRQKKKKKKQQQQKTTTSEVSDHVPDASNDTSTEQSNKMDSLQYSLDLIKSTTRNFENKLGQGGFGAVYKGRLPDGQEVAVKRLSEDSRQGFREFLNEVKLVANLQRRNLVQLLGFCLEGEEKLLIYEFVPNFKSRQAPICGYMAPEYAIAGVFSVKSDVYSFGVILLEIISGQSNNLFKQSHGQESLISYASRLWNMGTMMEIVDPLIGDNFSRSEVLSCIQVGIFCVQEDPSSRPTMESILPMLHNNSPNVQIQPNLSVTSSGMNVQREHMTGEQDLFDSQEYYQSYNRDTISQFNDLYPR